MSKQLKIEDQVYGQLERIKGRGETFSGVIGELLRTREKLFLLLDSIEESLKYRDWQRDQLRKITGQETQD